MAPSFDMMPDITSESIPASADQFDDEYMDIPSLVPDTCNSSMTLDKDDIYNEGIWVSFDPTNPMTG